LTVKHLSPELVSLIHHVELNQSGWWKKAVGQVIKGVLWKEKKPLTIVELKVALRRDVGISLPDDVLDKQLEILATQHSVVVLPGPNFKLTEREMQGLTDSRQKALGEQEECKVSFLSACLINCPTLKGPLIWEQFQRTLLNAIQVTGANLFHLLADGNLEREIDWVAAFLSRFNTEQHEGLRRVLSAFFALSNHACRNQVLRLLTAHFFAEASQLRPETLAVIEGKRTKRTIKIVLDTNIVFSVLKLHDNPGDDSALSLVDIAQHTGRNLEIKLYVLPATLEEAKRTLGYQMDLVDRIRTTQAMARAAVRQPLPSIVKKFFAAAALSPGLSASSFFQPYIDDLQTILRGKGIETLEAHPAIYNQRQDVVDDVLDEMRREEHDVPESKRKGYETHLHDAVLWHAVNDRRSQLADSPFDVEYWAVSIDWRLIAFDRTKREGSESKMPVVLHPSNLVQLVQFWVPRTQELEDSLVDSLRLPLFFQSFDPEDERATVQVLRAISRFENVGDLPEETVTSILANQALRRRLSDSDASNDEILALVKEELFSEHKAVLIALEQTKGHLSTVVVSLADERASREQSEKALESTNRQLTEAQQKVEAAEQKAATAEQRRLVKEQELLRSEQEAASSQISLVRLLYGLLAVVIPSVVGAGLGAAAYFTIGGIAKSIGSMPIWAAAVSIGLAPLVIAFVFSSFYTRQYPSLQSWWLTCAIDWVGKKAIAAPVTLAAAAVFQGGVWDWVKAFTEWKP
jgi:hypothetical protein